MSATWELSDLREKPRPQGIVICRTGATLSLVETTDSEVSDTGRTLTGKAAAFNTWTEIHDLEGHYLERISSTAFAKTLNESRGRVALMLDHGKHPTVGSLLLGELQSITAGADGLKYTARLHDGLPQLLLEGLRANQYGSSFRRRAIKSRYDPRPPRSAHNPSGLMEVVRTELSLTDISVTSLPAYKSTAARLRTALHPEPVLGDEEQDEQPSWLLCRDDAKTPAWLLCVDREKRGAPWQLRNTGDSPEEPWKLQRREEMIQRGHTYAVSN